MVRQLGSNLVLPSYCQRRLRGRGDCAAPALWDGLVGLWIPALGPSGTRLVDWSGYGNHGTLVNMNPGTDWVAGWYPPGGWALRFEGSDDRVSCPGASVLNLTGRLSMAAWVASFQAWNPANNKYRPILKKNPSYSGAGWGLHIYERQANNTAQLVAWTNSGSGMTSASYNVLSSWLTDTFYHVAGTFDGTKIRLYWNGRLLATGNANAPGDTLDKELWLGNANWAAAAAWPGPMAMAAVWNRALGPTEIQRLYGDPACLWRRAGKPAMRAPAMAVLAPWAVQAGQVHLTGPQAGQVACPGAQLAGVFSPGAARGQVHA
ncbi:MAG: LamG-like jellyroll fold domain-containing protein [Thermoguttaceae bacterium]